MHTVSDITRRLADQAESICLQLLPGGRQKGKEWLAGDVRGSAGDSLKVTLEGEHRGRWKDWADESQHGDLLDLWAAVRGVPLAEALKEVKAQLGIMEPVRTLGHSSRKYKAPPRAEDVGVLAVADGGRAMQYLQQERGLKAEIVRRFRVEGLPSRQAIIFPSYAPSGELVNRSYRTLPQSPGEKKRVWQDTDCAPSLFGWHALPKTSWAARAVLLCEGQIDAMSWAQWGVAALSIPNGTGMAWIEYEWDHLALFDHIYLAFDSDAAGLEIQERVCERLGRHRCLTMSLPHKDANECLLKGCTVDEVERWFFEARLPRVKGLVRAQELQARLQSELRPKPEPFTLDFLRVAWPYSGYYCRPGEVTVWTGISGHGKSTLMNYLALNVVSTGPTSSVFIASMEVKPETTLRRIATAFFHEAVTSTQADEFLEEFGARIVFADVVGYIRQEALLEMMRFSFRRYGVVHCIIDSLMRIEGLEEEFAAQGDFMNHLQQFAKETGCHVHLVAHPRKLPQGVKLDSLNIKGSSLIVNNADNIVSISRNKEKDTLRRENKLTPLQEMSLHDTEIRVEKQRENGWQGAVMLRYNARSLSYEKL
ncbi:MAG: AAA family ATPase [Verrucomicrobium sp.]